MRKLVGKVNAGSGSNTFGDFTGMIKTEDLDINSFN